MSKKLTAEEAKEALQTYSPFYMEFYRKGVVETVELKVKGKSEAFRLRKRLHSFRKLLQLAEHPLFTSAATIKITMKKDDFAAAEIYTIATAKRDEEFDDIFKAAGLSPDPTADEMSDDFESEMFSSGDK